jgi:poly(A) polymerase
MFALQPRLEYPRGRRALRVLETPKFRAAYDLLLLRAERGLASQETADWWTRLQEVSAQERNDMVDRAVGEEPRMVASVGAGTGEAPPVRSRRRRRRRRPSSRG